MHPGTGCVYAANGTTVSVVNPLTGELMGNTVRLTNTGLQFMEISPVTGRVYVSRSNATSQTGVDEHSVYVLSGTTNCADNSGRLISWILM